MYLLDTNVVSELRKRKPHQGVIAWFRQTAAETLYISAVTIGEIQAGIEITREQDAEKADEIESWLDSVAHDYIIIPADARIFRHWAYMRQGRSSHHGQDVLIAATALVRDLCVVTRNVEDFKTFGVPLLNPFTKNS